MSCIYVVFKPIYSRKTNGITISNLERQYVLEITIKPVYRVQCALVSDHIYVLTISNKTGYGY